MAESIGSASPTRLGPQAARPLPPRRVADLRTGYAGETGAVMIYRGVLATTRDAAARFNLHLAPAAPASAVLRLWIWTVGAGSRWAVKICRRV